LAYHNPSDHFIFLLRQAIALGKSLGSAERGAMMSESKTKYMQPRIFRQTGDTLDIAVLIDAIFEKEVLVKEGNSTQRITCIQAIIHQLWLKSLGGSRKAHRLCMRYLRFVASQARDGGFEMRFGPDMLTGDEVQRKGRRKS
jgi:hypothetical protein